MTQTPHSYGADQEDTQEGKHVQATLSEQVRLGKLSLEVSMALIAGGTLQEMLTSCTEALVRHLDAAITRIWTINEEEKVLELQASSGMYTHLNGEDARIPIGSLKIGLIAAECKPHLTNTVIGNPHVSDQEWAKREGMIAFAGYPLLMEDRAVGVVAIFARHPLGEIALQAMATIANGIALGIERQHVQEQLTSMLLREQTARLELETIVAQRTTVLHQLNAELQRSNQELQSFAYVASHDLQEPLRKIQAFGNLLEEEYGQALGEGKAYLDRMINAAARMRILINDLLAFSRVTSKALPFSPVDLTAIAYEVLDDLESQVQTTQGTIEIRSLPTIEADPLQMRQMFQNLMGNALKFHHSERPPVVKVYAEVQPDSAALQELTKQQCVIFVQDNGIGFDEKYLDRIFTVFQRLHGKSDYEGTGIGLAVVRKIVERHGGTITARSVIGEGTTFIVKLPMRHTEKETK